MYLAGLDLIATSSRGLISKNRATIFAGDKTGVRDQGSGVRELIAAHAAWVDF
jgi:hypothetical protein